MSVSYSNSVSFSAGDPQDVPFHDGTGVNPEWRYVDNTGGDPNSFQWPPPDPLNQPPFVFPASTGITINTPGIIQIDGLEFEGALRFNEEANTIERFEGGVWKLIGHGIDLPSIEVEEEDDDFEIGGAL